MSEPEPFVPVIFPHDGFQDAEKLATKLAEENPGTRFQISNHWIVTRIE